jgi:hypothetical protein
MPDITVHAGAQRTRVLLFTDRHRIRGYVALAPGARLTDYLEESKRFIPVTDAEVATLDGAPVRAVPFLAVSRAHIEMILPDEGRPGGAHGGN